MLKKNKYEKDGSDFEDKINKIDKKIPDVTSLVKKTDFNAKDIEIEGKIPSVSGLATSSALTAVENKIPDVSIFVKKTGFNTKVTEIEGKIPDVSRLVKKTDYATEIANIKNDYVTSAALNARRKELIQKIKVNTEVKKINDKIASNSFEVLTYNNRLNQSKDALERYASCFRGKNYFDGNDGAQNTLVFQTMQKHFNLVNKYEIDKWKSKGLSNQYLGTLGTIGDVLLSKPIKPMHVIFKGKGTLVQNENDIIAGGPIINIYIVYKTSPKTKLQFCFQELFIWCN